MVSERVLGPDESKTKTKSKYQKEIEEPEVSRSFCIWLSYEFDCSFYKKL